MKPGDVIEVPTKRVGQNICPLCGCTQIAKVAATYECGYSGQWKDDTHQTVKTLCNKSQEVLLPLVFEKFDLLSELKMDKPKIKSQVVSYEYNLDAIKQLFAQHLEVPVEQVSLRFTQREIGDDRFGPPHSEVNGVEVSVKTQ